MELEEAVKELQERVKMLDRHIKNYEEIDCKTKIYLQLVKEKEATKTVLQALENYKTHHEKYMNGELFSAKQMKFIKKEYIPKKKIEDKIKTTIEEYKIKIKRTRELENLVINTPEEYKERMKLYEDITCLDIEFKTYKELLEDK